MSDEPKHAEKQTQEKERLEKERRWRLALGVEDKDAPLSPEDRRMSAALDALYDAAAGRKGGKGGKGGKRKAGLGRSAPKISKWLGDIRSYFPSPVVQVIQRDAFERAGLKQMLTEPEFLAALEADVHLVADIMSLRGAIPERSLAAAREVVAKVVAELMARLERRTAEALRGAVDKRRRSFRPRPADIDWDRTIRANLRHYQPEHRTVVPERLIGFHRKARRQTDLDEVVLCVDQSGSMASSVVYASIFAAVMASLPVVRTRLVCFDTAVLDLTDDLSDPVSALFGVQLGGGTDINQALAYCESKIERPRQTHLVLITDLYEGGDAEAMLGRAAALTRAGVNVITLLALSDDGKPAHNAALSGKVAALGVPVFACTPDLFPEMMAAALKREDIAAWAAAHGVALARPSEEVGRPEW